MGIMEKGDTESQPARHMMIMVIMSLVVYGGLRVKKIKFPDH